MTRLAETLRKSRTGTQNAFWALIFLLIFFLSAAVVVGTVNCMSMAPAETPHEDGTQAGSSQGVSPNESAEEPRVADNVGLKCDEPLKEYADIAVTVMTAIIVALLSIAVTIFAFLKSALDRIIDENTFIAKVTNVYKSDTSKELVWLCVLGFLTLLLSIVWHLILTFNGYVSYGAAQAIFALLGFAMVANIIISILFWRKCIRIEDSLQAVLANQCAELKEQLNTFDVIRNPNSSCYDSIGDWSIWEDNKDLSKEGKKICDEMTVDQFVNLFLRSEILLLSGERGVDRKSPNKGDIITILQERSNILNPNSGISEVDLKDREYLGGQDTSVMQNIIKFEMDVGYNRKDIEHTRFFNETRDLYLILEQYRNLLISQKYTNDSRLRRGKEDRKKNYQSPDDKETLAFFAKGLYYFFLRILSVFVSALHISDFSFNGFALNFANFYNSTLEEISLYSSEFYHTIFARTQMIRLVMDISHFDNVDFFNARITNSTLNNAEFHQVKFENTQVDHAGISSCVFDDCRFLNSEFTDSIWNNSEFIDCTAQSLDFSRSKMKGVVWQACEIRNCKFENVDLQDWVWKQGSKPIMEDCNFNDSTWDKMQIVRGNLDNSTFFNALFSNSRFDSTSLKSGVFAKSDLSGVEFYHCGMKQASFEEALLFDATISHVDMNMANLSNVSAVRALFETCALTNSNCEDADFSEAKFTDTCFVSARLYNCSLMEANLSNCKCDYILADHLQFTFAECSNSSFSYCALSESNLTSTKFFSCDFTGSDMSLLNATKVRFSGCILKSVDFSGTRFIDTEFRAARAIGHFVKNCNFTNCQFINVSFDDLEFEKCIFKNAVFIHCTVNNIPLTKKTALKLCPNGAMLDLGVTILT